MTENKTLQFNTPHVSSQYWFIQKKALTQMFCRAKIQNSFSTILHVRRNFLWTEGDTNGSNVVFYEKRNWGNFLMIRLTQFKFSKVTF